MPRDAEEHEAWAASVAQALYEAAENAAMGFMPDRLRSDASHETHYFVRVKGRPPE